MMRIIVSVVIFVIPMTALSDDCPHFHLKPGEKNLKPFLNLKVSESCDPALMFDCDGGKKAFSRSKPMGTEVRVALRCFENDDKDIENYIAQKRPLNIAAEIEDGKKTSLQTAQAEKDSARKAALAKGIPAIIFDRAYANYLELMKQGKTSRGCFMAADLTTPGNGKTWTVCIGSPTTITEAPTFWGSGKGATCKSHIFHNNYSQCARFFGNKPDHCLSAGGSYITGEVMRDTGVDRQFVTLLGLDKGENDNTDDRKVGIHQTSTDDGQKDYVGRTDPINYSNGCITMPFKGSRPISADMTDYSSRQPQGGLALYVYPAKSDIVEFNSTGKAPYWNAQCAKTIGNPGWVGTDNYVGPSPTQIAIKPQENSTMRRSPAGVQ